MGMYILRRVVWTIPVLLLATFLAFGLMQLLPTGPFDNNRLARINPAVMANLEAKYGLDKPWYEQYARYVKGLALGGRDDDGDYEWPDMGPSLQSQTQSVREIIADTLPVSMLLGSLAFLFAAVVGTAVGVISALKANTVIDYGLTLLSSAFFAIPLFVTATYWVAYQDFGWDSWSERWGPILVLGLAIMPYFTRLVRASMLETLQSDFITTARAKGLPYRVTVARHMLRNSLIPVVTNAGPLFGFVLTGSFIIENIMNIPGIASQFVDAIRNPQDLNMVLGTTVVLSVLIIFLNLVVDVVVSFLDPRIVHD